MRFDGKVVVITGGSSGLGKAAATLFAAEGARVFIGDVSVEEGVALAEQIGARFIETDVSECSQVERLIGTAKDEGGQIDVVFNNAGIIVAKNLVDTEDGDFARLLGINFNGVFYGNLCRGANHVGAGPRVYHQYRIDGRYRDDAWHGCVLCAEVCRDQPDQGDVH